MTTPIDPSDINALAAIARKATRFDGFIPATVAMAIARAVVPAGYHVIADDDLRDVLALVDYRRFAGGDAALVGRLRAVLGGERP